MTLALCGFIGNEMINPNITSRERNADEDNLVDEFSQTVVSGAESDRLHSDSAFDANPRTFTENDPGVEVEIDDSGALCL